MNPSPLRPAGPVPGLFFTALLAASAAAGACEPPRPDARIGAVRSVWSERGQQGNALLREEGVLRELGLGLSMECGGWSWSATATHASGQRDYDGQSSLGAPIQTVSDIRQSSLALQAMRPLAGGDWSVGARWVQHQINRDLASTGTVLGYPERYRYGQGALGVSLRALSRPQLSLTIDGWLGKGPGGHVNLRLPGYDAANLPLGGSTVASLGLHARGGEADPSQAGWSWHAHLGWERQHIDAGDPRAITRNGIPVLSATQPETRMTRGSLGVGAAYRFR